MCNGIRLDHIPDWEEWILAESRRRYAAPVNNHIPKYCCFSLTHHPGLLRTCIILVFIIHIFAIEHAPGVPKCGGFADLPLPCSKRLWLAADKATWEAEYRKVYMGDDCLSASVKRLPTYRDLIPDLQDGNERSDMGNLSAWFSVMDDLGTTVMMAVSTL
jgi:hypothetical protein